MINEKNKKIKIVVSAVLLGFIIGFLIGIIIGSNKKKPTIYASADVYSNELYIYEVNQSALAGWVSADNKYLTLYPRSSNVGYLIYSVEMEYPIIIYSRAVQFEVNRDYNLYAHFMDENTDVFTLAMDEYDFYIFCNSTQTNFNNQFSTSNNVQLTINEIAENILSPVNPNNLNINGFSLISNDNTNIYNQGYEAGHTQGFADGYNEALNEGVNPLNNIFSFVYYFMNYELLPNFKMYYLFLIGVGAVLFRTIVKAGLI